ncbi:DUF368 domain-containing protein [Aureivirga sp. CE67]|uniref:DUF368 domain-containing protein n=1 Tax=Aureivirga sp. CE67 TaxID=1788983 RepID=UPI0018CA7D1F|nr:DUF368 domain-containing protein [Aureivirga sp. CE67]
MARKERKFLDYFGLFIKGLSMGAANKVPGVSGGTVSFVLGFYEELIYSFKKFNGKALKLLLSRRFKSFFQYINAPFLLLIMGGSTFSYFSVSLVLDYFITHFELYVWSWFFGLIIGSIIYISKGFKDWNVVNIISMLIGVGIGIAISFMNPAKENDNLWFVFFCGIIGVSGMTLPGLSGSFILILLGNYVLLLVDSVNALSKAISAVFTANWEAFNDPHLIKYLKIAGMFTAGSAFGLVSLSHILGYVLKRWHGIVISVIIGFITGSLGIVWPWKNEIYRTQNGEPMIDAKGNYVVENYERFLPNLGEGQTWLAIFYILVGIGVVLLIDYLGNRKTK